MNSPPIAAWPTLLREVYAGTSVGRALMHLQARDYLKIRGLVVDIGGGRRQTYLRYVQSECACCVTIDIELNPQVDVVASATNMPLERDSVDTVLCFNVLEHIFDYRAALSEISRVMKSDATLFGWVPFIIGVHGAPNDYFRYTKSSLEALLLESGLAPVRMEYCGNVFLSAFDLIRPHIRFWFIGRLLRTAGFALALVSYHVFAGASRFFGRSPARLDMAPSGIWFTARHASS